MELVRNHHRLIHSGRFQPNLVGSTVLTFSAPVPRFRTNLSLRPLSVDRSGRSGSAGWAVLTRAVVFEGVSVGGGLEEKSDELGAWLTGLGRFRLITA